MTNNNYFFNTSNFKNAVEIKIKLENGIMEFLVPKEMISASSIRLFVLWTTLPSVVLILIALIFLKNQIIIFKERHFIYIYSRVYITEGKFRVMVMHIENFTKPLY